MKRAPIVLSGTALGLVGLVGFHASSPSTTLASSRSSSATSATTQVASASNSSSNNNNNNNNTSSTTSGSRSSSSQSASAAPSSGTSASTGTRTAVGQDIPYQFGDLEVKVTVTGSKITDVSLVKANVVDPRSASIDQYAIPMLRSQALNAQSANIQGVSGASYTSQAYAQSLQSALDKLKA